MTDPFPELARFATTLDILRAPTRNRQGLMRRILWRLQAEEEGDLSERARRRARELADDALLRLTAPRPPRAPMPRAAPKVDPRLPRPGSVITRLYKERLVEVTVTRDGLLYEGKRYRSLSAVAGEVTGSHVNGFRFFGLAAKKNFERETIAERTRDKLAAARRHGKWVGGSPVLGYDRAGSKLVVNPQESERVRAIFELYLRLGSLIPTVRELGRRGWRTKQWTTRKGTIRGGAIFRKNSLHHLLTNVVYLGKVRHHVDVYDGEHEAIVLKELFEAVGGRLRQQRRRVPGQPASSSAPLLGGLVYCTACGCRMAHTYAARGKRRFRYYLCDTASSPGWDQCPAPSLPAARLERFVLDQLRGAGALDGSDRIRRPHQQRHHHTS